LRDAIDIYLSPYSSPKDKLEAETTLFGLHLSPLPGVCRALGIDCHAARMTLIEWKLKGLTGDPIFGFLTKPGASDRYEMGLSADVPALKNAV
jgi:hypothetical protein